MTTITSGIAQSPRYTGVNPDDCLSAADLIDIRPGAESGTWIGNVAGSAQSDSRSIVIVSGPYGSDSQASQYAAGLQGTELATAGGRWVAVAALTSNLNFKVNAVAQCMAAGG